MADNNKISPSFNENETFAFRMLCKGKNNLIICGFLPEKNNLL